MNGCSSNIIFLVLLSNIYCVQSTTRLYSKTSNISQGRFRISLNLDRGIAQIQMFTLSTGSWTTALKTSGQSKSLLSCASMCQLAEETDGNCNAFKFSDDTGSCQLAKVWILPNYKRKEKWHLMLDKSTWSQPRFKYEIIFEFLLICNNSWICFNIYKLTS